jgi:hypothetical protein
MGGLKEVVIGKGLMENLKYSLCIKDRKKFFEV